MPVYQNQNNNSTLLSVEFPETPDDGLVFLHLKQGGDTSAVRQWLAAEAGMQVVAETQAEGETLLIAAGDRPREGMLAAFAARGETLNPAEKRGKLADPWIWRGITSFAGQSLQLFSSYKSSKSGADRAAIAGFAISNLMANVSNITFGTQKKDDPHQLRYLKEQFNQKWSGRLPDGGALPSPDERRSDLRAEVPTGAAQGAYELAKKYSVTGGEVGLRIFGASSLSFPITKWKNVGKAVRTGSLEEVRNENPVTYKAGLITLLGKFVSLVSKEPDPYNPKKASALDKLREKVTFPLSSVIEGGAAAWMAYDRFKNQKITVGGKERPDFFGGIGNLIFVGGYAIRFFAPFGTRQVDMKELSAHVTDSLVTLPREALPAAMAEAAVDIHQHFKGKGPSLAEIYTGMATDLRLHHQIDILPGRTAEQEAFPPQEEAQVLVQEVAHPEKTFARPEMRRKLDPESLRQPGSSHQEKAALRPQEAKGLG